MPEQECAVSPPKICSERNRRLFLEKKMCEHCPNSGFGQFSLPQTSEAERLRRITSRDVAEILRGRKHLFMK